MCGQENNGPQRCPPCSAKPVNVLPSLEMSRQDAPGRRSEEKMWVCPLCPGESAGILKGAKGHHIEGAWAGKRVLDYLGGPDIITGNLPSTSEAGGSNSEDS